MINLSLKRNPQEVKRNSFFANFSQNHRSELFKSIAYAIDYTQGKFYFPIDGTFCVEKILDTKTENGNVYYFVKFVGWDENHNRWISKPLGSSKQRKTTSFPPVASNTVIDLSQSDSASSNVIIIDDPLAPIPTSSDSSDGDLSLSALNLSPESLHVHESIQPCKKGVPLINFMLDVIGETRVNHVLSLNTK